jgi:hypothetical protein
MVQPSFTSVTQISKRAASLAEAVIGFGNHYDHRRLPLSIQESFHSIKAKGDGMMRK